MGFGHRVYKNYDPRAKIIKTAADEVFEVTGGNPLLEIALELERIALEDDYFVKRKLYPNVDFYSGLIYEAIGFPVEMFPVLFAIPRTGGWVAQWHEMIDDPEQKIARPRQIYTGERRATTCRWTAAERGISDTISRHSRSAERTEGSGPSGRYEAWSPSARSESCSQTSRTGRRRDLARARRGGLVGARPSHDRRRGARGGAARPGLGRRPLRRRGRRRRARAQGARARPPRGPAPALHRHHALRAPTRPRSRRQGPRGRDRCRGRPGRVAETLQRELGRRAVAGRRARRTGSCSPSRRSPTTSPPARTPRTCCAAC